MSAKNLPLMRIAVLAIFICRVLSASAQETSPPDLKLPRTIFKVSPFQRAYDTYEVGLEVFNKVRSRSVQVSPGYRSHSTTYTTNKGISLELAHRGYFKVSPLNGN